MSMKLAAEVWRLKLDKVRAFILMALCDSAEDDGTSCYPRPAYVAWKTGSSLATVYRVLAEFEEQEILVKVGMRGDTPEYEIHLSKLTPKPPYERPRRGRPRKRKASQGEKSFSQGENILTGRKVFSQREKSSQGEKNPYQREKDKRSYDTPPTQAIPGHEDSKRGAYPSYRPILSTQLSDSAAREDETPTPPASRSPQFVALARKWANSQSGRRWRENMDAPFDWRNADQLIRAFSAYLEWTGKHVEEVAGDLVIA